MRFIDIPGQHKVKEGLVGMWQNNHFPHALMLVGRDGVGGLPMAIALAQYIFCEDKQANDSCGVCASCNKVKGLEHPDLHLSFPSISPKSGTKANSKFFIKNILTLLNENVFDFAMIYNFIRNINYFF